MSLPYLQPYLGLSNGLNTLHAAGGGGGIGGWVELGRTTLGSSSSTITVSSLSDKRYLMYLYSGTGSGGSPNYRLRFNGDTGSNYSIRRSENGVAETTKTSQTVQDFGNDYPTGNSVFGVGYTANYASKEKLTINHFMGNGGSGAGNIPNKRFEGVGKWANTSNAISSVSMNNAYTGNFDTGSELVVLGYDPADTHTNNFWEELASVNATGSSTNLSSGTITAKKYLWVQIWLDPSTAQNHLLRFNNDSGTNYATRYSTNGAADSTDGSVTNFNLGSGIGTLDGLPSLQNIFVINNSSNEKLAIIHSVWQNTAGAGNATGRIEMVGKWANTSNQITEIDVDSNYNWNSGSIMKVWGAD